MTPGALLLERVAYLISVLQTAAFWNFFYCYSISSLIVAKLYLDRRACGPIELSATVSCIVSRSRV